MSAERIKCIVPFCRRTTRARDEWDEWICADHYKPVPRRLKTLRRRARRLGRHSVDLFLWGRIKSFACEAAGGIA